MSPNRTQTLLSFLMGFLALSLVLEDQAFSATLVVSNGELTGANGVVVGEATYNVTFHDGSCISLFAGCDDAAADLDFGTSGAAQGAGQALLDQVFLDGPLGSFDSVPSLTVGCESSSECWVFMPYALHPNFPTTNLTGGARNRVLESDDRSLTGSGGIGWDTTAEGSLYPSYAAAQVYALWTVVPEPNTGLLLLLGLAATSALRRTS